MKVEKRIELYKDTIQTIQTAQVVDIFARLVELFAEIKEVQPNLERLHIGMGTYSFAGKYISDCLDYGHVTEDYPDLEIVKRFKDNDGDNWVIYKSYDCEHFEDHIMSVIDNNFNQCELETEHIDPMKYLNDACIEFVQLCNYVQEINYTTLFDGVNENGVIVTYGKGSHLDTYVDAKESEEVELLDKAKIPIVFFNSTTGKYFNRKYLSF